MIKDKDKKKIVENLNTLRKKLLSISVGNQAVNFSRTKSSNVEILEPSLSDISETLKSEKTRTVYTFSNVFAGYAKNKKSTKPEPIEIVEKEDNSDRSVIDSILESQEIQDKIAESEKQINELKETINIFNKDVEKKDFYTLDEIQEFIKYDSMHKEKGQKSMYTSLFVDLEKVALKNITKKSNLYLDEYAINILYMGLGFFHYYELKNKNVMLQAPLFFIPVEITQNSIESPYKLRFNDDDIIVNETLLNKLRLEFKTELNFTVNNDLTILQNFEEFKNVLITKMNHPEFYVTQNIVIGLFSFTNLNLADDLEVNTNLFSENELLAHLFLGIDDSDTASFDITNRELENIEPEDNRSVVDTDSSQERAIRNAINGHSFVLQGPPGTGKSQTITNLISELLSRDKKILFVAEKKAALDVVYNNLKKVKLDEFAIPLHDLNLDKKIVIKELNESLLNRQEVKIIDKTFLAGVNNEYESSSELLDNYRYELTFKRKPLDLSFADIYNRYCGLDNQFESLVFDIANYPELDNTKLNNLITCISEYEDSIKSLEHDVEEHLFYGLNRDTLNLKDKETLKDLFFHFSKGMELVIENYNTCSATLSLKAPVTVNQLKDYLIAFNHLCSIGMIDQEMINDINLDNDIEVYKQINVLQDKINKNLNEINELYTPQFLALDIKHYYELLKDNKSSLKRAFNKTIKDDIDHLSKFSKSSKVKFNNLYKDLEKLYNNIKYNADIDFLKQGVTYSSQEYKSTLASLIWFKKFKELQSKQSFEIEFDSSLEFFNHCFKNKESNLSNYTKFIGNLDSLFSDIEKVQQYFDIEKRRLYTMELDKLKDLSKEFVNQYLAINQYLNYNQKLKVAKQNGLDEFVTKLHSNHIKTNYKDYFLKRLYLLLLNYYIESNELLSDLTNIKVKTGEKKFAKNIQLLKQIGVHKIISNVYRQTPSIGGLEGINQEILVLRHESEKQRKIIPLRLLFEKIPNLILKLKPVLMMSPLSVATFLKSNNFAFDVVIFDEASQIRPEAAISSICRGKQVIIIGDTQQLPPTNFFNNVETDDEFVEDDSTSYESILALATTSLNTITLKWHYRSVFEELIYPSNAYIYKDLMTFPTTIIQKVPGTGIEYHHLEKGVYANHHNEAEADLVVKLLKEHADKYKGARSISVVAFGVSQADYIENKINNFYKKNKEYQELLNKDSFEPLFVKSIESVQGNERDTIIISVGYGPDEKGNVHMHFGPLNHTDGYKRLNVALTRAKLNMHIISSMVSSDIEPNSKSSGTAFLKSTLEFCEKLDNHSVKVAENTDGFYIANNLKKALEDRGYYVECNYGLSEMKVDLAVAKGDKKFFSLGILIDVLTLGQALTLKDCLIQKSSILMTRGWKIYKLYASAYILNKDSEIAMILNMLETPATEIKEIKVDKIPLLSMPKKQIDLQFLPYPSYQTTANTFYTVMPEIERLKKTIHYLSPVHNEELRKVLPRLFHHNQKSPVYSEELSSMVKKLINKLIKDGFVYLDDNFFVYKDKPIVFRKTIEKSERREFVHIHEQELASLIMTVVQKSEKISILLLKQTVMAECAYEKLTSQASERIDQILKKLKDKRLIYLDDESIRYLS